MNFNKKLCLELVKEESKSLREKDKILWHYDKAKHNELIGYLILLDDQIF